MKKEEKESETDTRPSFGESLAITKKLGLQKLDKIDIEEIDRDLLSKTSYQFARSNLLLPIKVKDGKLIVATANPIDMQPLDDLKLLFSLPVEAQVIDEKPLLDAVNMAYDLSTGSASEIMDDIAEGEADLDSLVHDLPQDLLETSDEAPVIRLVNSILLQAAKEKSSDIHIEPYERELYVRFRVDGALRNVVKPPKKLQSLLVSRIKVMAGLDIAEKRLPQDGRLKIVIAGKEIDIRISVIPTAHGERVVMRLLDKGSMLLGFANIGMKGELRDGVEKIITTPHGMILVCGPTGSGKTTTLYTALSHINSPDKNIITVEDPVEYQLSGIGQMQISTKIGLTFASGLRSILRQDPDVIMVGEIRDNETAQIAIQASLTGHLVFSTIHTNDSAGAITRLTDMGVEPFLIASSILGTLAQRLVRVLCKNCKKPYKPKLTDLAEIGLAPDSVNEKTVFYHPQGCERCGNSGYKGRTGVYELLIIDDAVRGCIVKKDDATTIRKTAEQNGFKSMRESGAGLAIAGITSVEEIARVTSDIE